ncbi:hypothetical protein RGQ29_025525 [Quercus rubra]|uniref:Leucine-rich repeat-containing N-terminal plant-type domain-containing protein n=1 Tax=Quercus rubra TaxID=3512 RepID=A0AAN7EYM6_QUERU|nr:hypothetical protein RGQ29_025525 [Quercus rubra]
MAKAGTFINYGEIATTFDCRPVQNRVVFGPPLPDTQNSSFFGTNFSNKVPPWNESVDCCSWEGVTCSEGRVVGLYLDNKIIYGKLDSSSSLFRLHHLQHLSLAGNFFLDSRIPPEFGNLTNLIYLNLSRISFNGLVTQLEIPIEISRLTRLVTLDLSYNSNDELGQYLECPNLVTLVQNLTRLTELYLDFVKISSQGNDWCQALSSSLPNLRVLSMSHCDLRGPLDSSLQKLQSLSIVDLSGNNFSAPILEFFADFRNLTFFDLSDCGLNGQFPKKIFQVPKLQTVDLSGQIPPSLGKSSQLESLDLSSNKLSGEIPVQLADSLTFLAVLNLSFNQLVGPIPYIKQFATFSETSYEGNKGLYGCPLKTNCTSAEPRSPPPTFEDSNSNSRPLIDWNFLSVELGFVFGFGMVIWPIMFCKRWRIWYCKHVDDILFRMFPQLYLGGKQYRGIRAQRNAGQRH